MIVASGDGGNAVREPSETSAGLLRGRYVPSPNSPLPFPPQHFAPPPTIAHVKPLPALMAVTPLVNPQTLTAVDRSLSRKPWPQHFTRDAATTAQV
jgi:hypothetical protein